MPDFDLRQHYLLLQALDEVGRALFGADWTGQEPWSKPCDDPTDIFNEKARVRVYANLSTIREPHYLRSGPVVADDRNASVTADNPQRDPIRHAAYVLRDEFELWLFGQPWAKQALLAKDREEQCSIHLRLLAVAAPKGKTPIRSDCVTWCEDKVPSLTKKEFENAWNSATPAHWHKAGRRKEETIWHILQ